MKRFTTIVIFLIAIFSSVNMPEPVQAQNGNGFFNNLFSGGQRGRNRRAAAAAQRIENQQVQTALNFFDFDAGVVDGVLGRQSRTAVSAFQSFLDMPPSGRLLDSEKSFLLDAFDHVINGDEETRKQIALNLVSAQEVLKNLYLGENPPLEEAEPLPMPALPGAQPSMRAFCTGIEAADLIDLVKAQFCNLRQLAIEDGLDLLETAPNEQPAEKVLVQCRVFAESMAGNIARMESTEAGAFVSEMAAWSSDTGVSPENLSRIAKTCLGVGYVFDDSEVAVASALALTGLSQPAYAEIMAYHVAFGLGLGGNENYTGGSGWLEVAISSLPEGMVELTGQESSQRAAIIVDVLNILAAQE